MKKLKLSADDLKVTSFTAQQERGGAGTVNGMQITGFTFCYCTDHGDCYVSNYCSYPGQPNNTCYDGCMTNQNGAC
ncbi:MAG TPA: hypothetical protein VGC13_29095 [Longimicrobium sp.]|jgi:hypothetical protein|uniref:hypothetical protein n=1 Tax=Longimicrobium sp. TaxID=2029185 RepID=UPI002EDB32BE